MILPQSRAAGLAGCSVPTHWLLLGPLAGVDACHAPLCCSRTQPELLGLGQGWGCEVGVDDGGVMMLVCQDCCNKALKWGGGRAQTTGTCHLIVGARGWKAKTEVSAGLTSFEDWAGRMCCRLSPWLVLSLCLFTWRSSRIPARL